MRAKDLLKERIIPAINEMYSISDSYYPEKIIVTYDDMLKYSPKTDDGKFNFPFYAFFLPEDEYDRIIKKYTRYLHSWYSQNYSQFETTDRNKKKYSEFKLAKENLEIARLDKYEEKKEMKIFSKLGYYTKRSRDREVVSFSVMNISPMSYDLNKYLIRKNMYNEWVDSIGGYRKDVYDDIKKYIPPKSEINSKDEYDVLYTFYYNFKNKISVA